MNKALFCWVSVSYVRPVMNRSCCVCANDLAIVTTPPTAGDMSLHTLQSRGNLILISISVLLVCVCVISGAWLTVRNLIPKFSSGSICSTAHREHTRTCWRTQLSLHWACSHLLNNLTTKQKRKVMEQGCSARKPEEVWHHLFFVFFLEQICFNLKHIFLGFVIQKYTQFSYAAFSTDKEPFPHKEKTWSLPLMWQWLLLSATGDTCLFPWGSIRMWLWLLGRLPNGIFVFYLIYLHKSHFHSSPTPALCLPCLHICSCEKELRAYNGMWWWCLFYFERAKVCWETRRKRGKIKQNDLGKGKMFYLGAFFSSLQ